MKLTQEQVQFIDRALADADFKYSDIRYEITDHIATAIEQQEGDFHTKFTNYVDIHKSEIFKAKRQFIKLARREAFTSLGHNLFRPWAVLFTGVITAAGMYAHNFYERADVADVLYQIVSVLFFMTFLPLLYNYITRKPVYCAVAMAASWVGLIIYIGSPLLRVHRLLRNSDLLFTYYGLLITIGAALLVTTLKLDRKYKLRYNGN